MVTNFGSNAMGLSAGTFPYRWPAVAHVTPFTYRDGITYLELLEEYRKYLLDLTPQFDKLLDDIFKELEAAIENVEKWTEDHYNEFTQHINDLVAEINNRVGPTDVQHFTVNGKTDLPFSDLWPNNHIIWYEATIGEDYDPQVVLPSNVTGSLPLPTEPDDTTKFALWPNGDGTFQLLTADQVMVRIWNEGGSFRNALDGQYAKLADLTTFKASVTQQLADMKVWAKDRDDFVDIRDYGAKVDGKTDDLAAVNAAIADARGRRVRFPRGTTMVSDTVVVPSHTWIQGEGMDNSVIKLTPDAPASAWVITNKNKTAEAGDTDIVIRDITLDWDCDNRPDITLAGGGTRGSGLTLANVHYSYVYRVHSKNPGRHGFDICSGAVDYPYLGDGTVAPRPSSYVVLEACETSNFYDDGITTHHSEFLTIKDCYSHNPRTLDNANGIEVDDGSRHVTLINNVTKECNSGIEVKAHGTAPAPHYVHIIGHTDIGSCRSYYFRHIGHHTADDPDSKSAYNIVASNLISKGCNNIKGFQGGQSPKALAISAYNDVSITGFQAMPDRANYPWDYSDSSMITIQYKARNVNLSDFNLRDFDSAYDIYVIGGGNSAERVNINNVIAEGSGDRTVYFGSPIYQSSVSNVIGYKTGGVAAVTVNNAAFTSVTNIRGVGMPCMNFNGTTYNSPVNWERVRIGLPTI